MGDDRTIVEALHAIRDEVSRVMALIKAVSEPAENVTPIEAIGRYIERNDYDAAVELAALCALGYLDDEAGPEAAGARAHQLLVEARAKAA